MEEAFAEIINTVGLHKKLGIQNNYIHQLRYKLKNGITIGLETKLRLLQKAGWRHDDKIYDRKDLVSLINFWKRTSQAARKQGPEYVIEKWERSRKK